MLAHSSILTIHNNAGIIKEKAQSETKVCVARLPQPYQNGLYQKIMMPLTFIMH
jgi:hypothetical protein